VKPGFGAPRIELEKQKAGERQDLTSREFAEALGVSESSVKRWVDDGAIQAHRTTGGHRRIPLSAAIAFIRRNRMVPVNPHLLSLPAPPALGEIDASGADWLADALMRDEVDQVRAIITGRYLSGADVAAIGDGLIGPVLDRIGHLWKSRGDGILIEHRAVTMCVQVMSELATWLPPLREGARSAVAAAGPQDPYLLPPLLTSLVLRERGMAARNLGPMTPPETIAIAAERYKPRLVAISISVPPEPAVAAKWIPLAELLGRSGAKVMLGGRCADSIPVGLRSRVQVGSSLSELAAYATGLLDAEPRNRRR
jgi:MerR family transcriptional regulator, light-induced transcriptional regulator